MAFKINVSTAVTVLDRKTPMAASSLHLPHPCLLWSKPMNGRIEGKKRRSKTSLKILKLHPRKHFASTILRRL